MKALLASWIAGSVFVVALAGPTISLGDLRPSNVKGRLGKALGTRTTIKGRFEPRLMGAPFQMTHVDGVAVDHTYPIFVRCHHPIERNGTYRFEGYESGEYGSDPEWLNTHPQVPFGFYSFFVATSVLEPTVGK